MWLTSRLGPRRGPRGPRAGSLGAGAAARAVAGGPGGVGSGARCRPAGQDINLASPSNPANLVDVGGTLYFTATEPTTDGAVDERRDGGGTVLVRDIVPGTRSASPLSRTAVGGTLNRAFEPTTPVSSCGRATDGRGDRPGPRHRPGRECVSLVPDGGGRDAVLHRHLRVSDGLWKSHGRPRRLVRDINPGSGGASPSNLTAVGGRLFFAATEPTTGRELRHSGRARRGTSWSAMSRAAEFVSFGPDGAGGFFAATEPRPGELWRATEWRGLSYPRHRPGQWRFGGSTRS
ncbi:MAG: hypothetical protein WKF75_02095 [Singulisphaera sp.]